MMFIKFFFIIVFCMNKDFFFCHVVLMCLFFSYVWGQTLFSQWGGHNYMSGQAILRLESVIIETYKFWST